MHIDLDQLHINDLPVQYKVNNFSYLFIDMIEDIQNLIASLKNNLINHFYHKIIFIIIKTIISIKYYIIIIIIFFIR